MERSDGTDKMAVCRELCCSLLMLLSGLLFSLALATVTYFSFQSVAKGATSCALWVDIPGRVVIFATCYYIASMCGFFPLPRRYHLYSFIEPFNVWRLKSWRRLFRNICFPIRPSMNWLQRVSEPTRDTLETPLLQDNNELFRDDSQRRSQSEPIDIRYPKSYVAPVFVSNPEMTPRNEIPELNKGLGGSISSMGSLRGDIVFPIMKGSDRYDTPDASIEELPDNQDKALSKYRKRYTEVKWTGEADANVSLPAAYDPIIAVQKPAKKSTALTDDEREKISRQERRRLAGELPQVHMNAPLPARRFSWEDDPLSSNKRDRLLVKNPAEDENLIIQRDPVVKLKNEMLKAHAADNRYKIPTTTALMLPKTNNQPVMYGEVKQPGGTIVNYKIKSPPKYQEIFSETKVANAPTHLQSDYAPVTSAQPLHKKHATGRQQEPTRCMFERPRLEVADEQFKLRLGKKVSTETNIHPTVHRRNRQPAGTNKEQETLPKPCNTETQLRQPRIRNQSQLSGRGEIRNPAKAGNSETSLNFPRFPWYNLRNPKGVSAWANKLHKKNLELEKREMERYSKRQRSHTSLNKLVKHLRTSLRSDGITQVQLPRSGENISLMARSSFSMKDFSPKPSDGLQTQSGVDKDKMGLTMNRYKLSEKHEEEKVEKRHLANRNPSLFLQISDRQNVERSNANEAPTRRRKLPSQRFQVKSRIRTRASENSEESTDFKREIRRDDQNFEGAPPNKLEQDTERTGTLRSVTEENATESFNRLQLEGLRRRVVHFEDKEQTNTEAAAATVESAKRDVSTADSNGNKPKASAKSNKAKQPHVKITIESSSSKSEDSESGSEQSKK